MIRLPSSSIQVLYSESTESTKRLRLGAGWVAMKHSVYIEHYTQKVPACDRLTPEEAEEAWIRDVNPSNTATEKDSSWLIEC